MSIPEPDFLPGPLPDGERVLWTGQPSRDLLAMRVFHVHGLGVYFGVLSGWAALSAAWQGEAMAAVLRTGLRCFALAVLGLALVAAYAWLVARSTRYVITTRRVILRVGIALPVTINVPFPELAGADLKLFGDKAGQIALDVSRASRRVSYFLLWPHVRPWRLSRPSPVLLALPDARAAASILERAVSEVFATTVLPQPQPKGRVHAAPLPA